MRLGILLVAIGVAAAQAPDPAHDPLAKAYEALRGKQYDEAISFFLKGIQAAPDKPAPRKDLAYTYLKVGETEEARDQFREAMRLDPADEHVALEYAFLCYETKEQAQARRVFDRLRRSTDAATRATAQQAFDNIDRPLRDGIERWTRAIERGGDNFSSHYELATLAEQRDDPALAARHYEAAWKLLPARRYLLIDLGRVWKALGRNERATAALLAASRGGEPRAAEKARELLPAHYPYASEFRAALELDTGNVELRRDLAFLLLRMGHQKEAESEFRVIADSDLLAATQLGFLYLARHDAASAAPLFERVLAGKDVELANRVRAVLRQRQVGDTAAGDAKLMAERSIKAGYLRDALRYLEVAHESDPLDFSVMLKLGWTYNILHDDERAFSWFELARQSPDLQIAADAARAYENLRPMFQQFRTTTWLFPMYSSRWRDLFSYGQIKTEWNPKALVHPYLSMRLVGDTRSHPDPTRNPLYFSESSVILGVGLATRPWRGLMLWGEAGSSLNYLSHHIKPDYRGGLAFLRGWGHGIGAKKSGWFLETGADALFMSRFHNDGLLYLQKRAGFTQVRGDFRAQFYWNTNATADVRREYWANFVETGPGVRLRWASIPNMPIVSFNLLRGTYTVENPRGASFSDFRVGLWYAFTH